MDSPPLRVGAATGGRLAAVLRGIWQAEARNAPLNATELTTLAPLLIQGGLSGLIWSRLPPSLRAHEAGERFAKPRWPTPEQPRRLTLTSLTYCEALRFTGSSR